MPEKLLGPMRGLMNDRNKCEFEHGLCAKALSVQKVQKHIHGVDQILNEARKAFTKTVALASENFEFPIL